MPNNLRRFVVTRNMGDERTFYWRGVPREWAADKPLAKVYKREAIAEQIAAEYGGRVLEIVTPAPKPSGYELLVVERNRYYAALTSIAANTCCDRCQEAALVARRVLEGPAMPSEPLPPCPVCNTPAERLFVLMPDDPLYFVRCERDTCMTGPAFPTEAEAVAAWNRLAQAARLLAAVERLSERTILYRSESAPGVACWAVAQPNSGRQAHGPTAAEALIALEEGEAPDA